jgi:serine/threonine-protein kinase
MVRDDLRDAELFQQDTALSLASGEALDSVRTELSDTDSGLPTVGVDSGEDAAKSGEARTTRDGSPGLTQLAFERRYQQRRVLGRGGMGEVRLCHDLTVGRDVAMKVIRARSAEARAQVRRRFVREARVQGQLEHPAIVPVYDLGLDPEGALYFTMKRVRGVSLSQVLEGLRKGDAELAQRYSERRLLTLFSQVCMAVHFAHEKGVVHRDLTPSNLMFGDFGEVYVLDWGLAALRGEAAKDVDVVSAEHALGAAQATGVMGTPGYMAPEQVDAPSSVDARADVYALGAILFELLTLERMHAHGSLADVLTSTLQDDGASPALRAPTREVPPELDRLTQEATRRKPAQRLTSAQALSRNIEAYLDGDRDLSLRKELARAHAQRAGDALSASCAPGADEAASRALAMREVSAALGLDPEHKDAQRTLVALITEPPRTVPKEAEAEMEQNRRDTYQMAGRAGVFFYFGYLLYLPLLLWMGIRDWGLFALGWGTISACALTTYLFLRFPPKRVDVPLVHLTVSSFTVACVSVMFGPFVLVPMLALGNSVAYISAIGHRKGLVPLAGCLAVIAPVVLRWLGLIPDNYAFRDGAWTILPSVFDIDALSTQVFLLVAVVGTVAPACLFVARLRKAYAEAEQKLQLQAWQLRQIVPL